MTTTHTALMAIWLVGFVAFCVVGVRHARAVLRDNLDAPCRRCREQERQDYQAQSAPVLTLWIVYAALIWPIKAPFVYGSFLWHRARHRWFGGPALWCGCDASEAGA